MTIKTLLDNESVRVTRNTKAGGHKLSLLKFIRVERGTINDWRALQELHYKGHSLAAGSHFIRTVLHEPDQEPTLIGIMVFANPVVHDGGRNEVFPNLKPKSTDSRMVNQGRLKWINSNMKWNNRTVLDTMYRSAGIAYRMKNLGYRLYAEQFGRRYIESRSSMGRFNPFSIKSGMKFTKPKIAHALTPGLEMLTSTFKSDPADIVAIQYEIECSPAPVRVVLEKKLREFYYRWSSVEKSGDKRDIGMTRVNGLPIEYVLKQTMQLIYSATVYWIYIAPKESNKLPAALPLLAFDEQGACDPLARDWSAWEPSAGLPEGAGELLC